MNDNRAVAAAAGFAFVAAWIGFSFGEALLCLLGAAVFWVVASVLTGKLDLAALQARFTDDPEARPALASPPPAPKPRTRPRVL